MSQTEAKKKKKKKKRKQIVADLKAIDLMIGEILFITAPIERTWDPLRATRKAVNELIDELTPVDNRRYVIKRIRIR